MEDSQETRRMPLLEQWKMAHRLHKHEDDLTWQKFNYFVAANGILISVLGANWQALAIGGNLKPVGQLMSSFGFVVSVGWVVAQWRGLGYMILRIHQAREAEDAIASLNPGKPPDLTLYHSGVDSRDWMKQWRWRIGRIPTRYVIIGLGLFSIALWVYLGLYFRFWCGC